jgi:hypothetical protein
MANGLVILFFHWLIVCDFQLIAGLLLETAEMGGASFSRGHSTTLWLCVKLVMFFLDKQ